MLVILGVFAIVIASYFLFIHDSGPVSSEDPASLLGTWERTDYPYKIEVISFTEDGLLEAKYFNPQPINVGKARWEVFEHQLYMFVELQDVNYPGSAYNLIYSESPVLLEGTYFQAVAGEAFAVSFARLK